MPLKRCGLGLNIITKILWGHSESKNMWAETINLWHTYTKLILGTLDEYTEKD